jgi:hypothetical protein
MIKPQRTQRIQRKGRERWIIPMPTDLIWVKTELPKLYFAIATTAHYCLTMKDPNWRNWRCANSSPVGLFAKLLYQFRLDRNYCWLFTVNCWLMTNN